MKELMQDHHRERILAQLDHDHQRQLKEQETVEKAREAVFNATFNNIAVILWRSGLLVEETRVLGENHQPATSH
jgi:hypothetical protein